MATDVHVDDGRIDDTGQHSSYGKMKRRKVMKDA